jgi:hypothetical protein
MLTDTPLNRITAIIIDAAIAVHRALGPGLLESVYITCLIFELRRRGLKVEEQQYTVRGLAARPTNRPGLNVL